MLRGYLRYSFESNPGWDYWNWHLAGLNLSPSFNLEMNGWIEIPSMCIFAPNCLLTVFRINTPRIPTFCNKFHVHKNSLPNDMEPIFKRIRFSLVWKVNSEIFSSFSCLWFSLLNANAPSQNDKVALTPRALSPRLTRQGKTYQSFGCFNYSIFLVYNIELGMGIEESVIKEKYVFRWCKQSKF